MPSQTTGPLWPWQVQQGFPWPGVRYFVSPEALITDSGAILSDWQLAYEEWGAPEGLPVVIFHALTGDSHVATHGAGDPPGWWNEVLGEGGGIDLARYRVLCFNVLGGAMGSTGPSSLAPDGKPWGSRFPLLTVFDMVRAAHVLMRTWSAEPVCLIGGSMGGMLAYAYAALYPEHVRAVMAIGAPIRHEPWAIAYHAVGRAAIVRDPAYRGGDYYDGPFPVQGLATARMADMISYQHPRSMQQKFGRRRRGPTVDDYDIVSYLTYQGDKLIRRFDANTYITLTRAMDEFALEWHHIERLRDALVWMVGIESDLLYLPEEIEAHYQQLAAARVPARLSWLRGPWGHDTFLVEQAQMSALIAAFLQETAR
ncbi:MAG: homoserine O-acetyltransferase [Firmicutes bacterium]|nr:homoserine O-acetyltransferase [Bacillota bacterium]